MRDGTTVAASAREAATEVAALRRFDQAVPGVDGSEAGYEAVRQASRLVAPDRRLELFTAR